MKKRTLKPLAYLCTLCLLLSTLLVGLGGVARADEPVVPTPPETPVMEAKQTAPFSRITEGTLNDTSIFVRAGSKASTDVTATGVKPLGLNAMGVQLDTETAVRETWNAAFTADYIMEAQSAQLIAGFSGALLYFKLPDTGSETNEIWFQANDADNTKYMQLKTGAPVYTLANGEKTWVTIPQVTLRGSYRVLTLPDGFDGYIYLPLDAFDTSANTNPFTALTKIQFNIRNFGGPGGSAIVGPFLLTSNALRTKDQVWLNAEADGDNKAVVRNLFTGEVEAPVVDPPVDPPVDPDPPAALAADAKAPLNRIPAGPLSDSSILNKAGGSASEITVTGVKPLGLNAMGAKLDTAAEVRQTWPPFVTDYLMEINDNQPIDDYTGALLYVKLPVTGSSANTVWVQLCDASGTPKYFSLGSGKPVYTLENGQTKWKQMAATPIDGHIGVTVPDGFDGYISLPFSSFRHVENATLTAFSKLQFSIRNFGGTNGSAIVGPLFLTANNLRTKDGAWLDKEVDGDNKPVIRNLFTGEVMDESDLEEDLTSPPEDGTIVPELPESTLDDGFTYTVSGPDSVLLNWPAAAGADFYRVDLYVPELGDVITYKYLKSVTANTNSVSLTGLEQDTSYYVVIHAFSGKSLLGIYQVDALAINSNSGPDDSGNGGGNTQTGDEDGGKDQVVTGDALPMGILVGFILVCGISITASLKKRRTGGSAGR